MKKLLIVFFLIITSSTFGQQRTDMIIWNGLSTGMTREQLITRTLEIGGPNTYIKYEERARNIGSSSKINTGIRDLDNADFYQGLRRIPFESRDPIYHQYSLGSNITLYFYKDRLISVTVQWSTTRQIQMENLNREFGRPTHGRTGWQRGNLLVCINEFPSVFGFLSTMEVIFLDLEYYRYAVRDDEATRRAAAGMVF